MPCSKDTLKSPQGIKGTREAGIGIKLRKRFLGFADGESLVQGIGQGDFQTGLVSFGFQRCNDGKSLPTGG